MGNELRTVAIPCIWYQKGYPAEEQAHVALRTVRKCVDKMTTKIDSVVFVAASAQEMELYESILPRYFPRTAQEAETAMRVLPDSCWNPWGEVTVEERRIHVSPLVVRQQDDDDDRGEALFDRDSDKAFLDCKDDADTAALRRLEGAMTEVEDAYSARQTC